MNNRSEFANLIKVNGYKTGAEIGVRYGYFSAYLASQTGIKWYSIDPWEKNEELNNPDEVWSIAKSVLDLPNITVIKNYAECVVKTFEDESLDFIYIDALHDYESVRGDLNDWWPKLARNGCMAGHDFSQAWPGLMEAVLEFEREKYLSICVTGVGDIIGEGDHGQPSWYLFK